MGRFTYTPEMLEFLKKEYPHMWLPELTAAFNATFKLAKTSQQIKSTLRNHGFTSGRPVGRKKGRELMFSSEQIEFIKTRYQEVSLQQVTDDLNNRFSTDFAFSQVRGFTRNHAIRSGRTGQYKRGNEPPNKGVKGWNAGGRSIETRFKKGRRPQDTHNYQPIGTVRMSKDGYLERKVTDDRNLVPARRWQFEHRLLWEEANGPIPEGAVIVFQDGDRQNLALDNLRCVTRGVLQYMNKTGLNHTTGEARKAAILTAEVLTKTKQMERG